MGENRMRWSVGLAAALLAPAWAPAADEKAATASPAFAQSVQLDQVRLIAVQHDGRFKTLDTLSREMVRHITGTDFFTVKASETDKGIRQDPVFTYLDLVFNNQAYTDTRLIFIKKRPIRHALAQAAADQIDKQEREQILTDGRVSLKFLALPAVQARLIDLNRDIMTTAKEVDALQDAASLASPRVLLSLMRVLPPPESTSVQDRWFGLDDLAGAAPTDAAHAGLNTGAEIPGLEPSRRGRLLQFWNEARQAWLARDAAGATAALNGLAASLAEVNPAVYPPMRKLALEHWYYKYKKMTWTWVAYAIAVIFLLMGIVYRWKAARVIGVSWFVLAFGLHTVASGIRWYLAGRIPNSNMFEAVTAAAWFGAVVAIFFELAPAMARRKLLWKIAAIFTPAAAVTWAGAILAKGIEFDNWQQWGPVPITALIVFAVGAMALIAMTIAPRVGAGSGLSLLGACVAGMVALMAGAFLPVQLNSDISNRMPVLNDLWLYIHTNMIILSYALIVLAYVTAAIYVVGRLLTRPTTGLWMSMVIPTVVVPFPVLVVFFKETLGGTGTHEWRDWFYMILPAWAPFLLVVVMYALAVLVRALWHSSGRRAYEVWEGGSVPLGAGMVSGGSGSGMPPAARRALSGVPDHAVGTTGTLAALAVDQPVGLARVLDGVTMLLMELSFITLWTGIIMGAVWADHSWGRPWGWDPKEVFALNTWIIFLILVHVRIKVQDKALWTAVLAVIGCAVMLFNWIVVNFFITGLHSYA